MAVRSMVKPSTKPREDDRGGGVWDRGKGQYVMHRTCNRALSPYRESISKLPIG